MRVPVPLSEAFGASFEDQVFDLAVECGLAPSVEDLKSPRFLARSVLPHLERLSERFNRLAPQEGEASLGVDRYWKDSSNPANLRLAYFLFYMPPNLFRVSAVWAELSRLGYRWPANRTMKAIELGAGPASGACGIAAGEAFAPCGLPSDGNWALIEQDRSTLQLGALWSERYFASRLPNHPWSIRSFHRTLQFSGSLLPPSAPKFNLWVSSYFINETTEPLEKVCESLLRTWQKHLDEDGLVILVEPALRVQSRRLLELRRLLLQAIETDWKKLGLQVLLPCLGHQACGALADPEDWCHEEVSWWRPPYLKWLDQKLGLDHKSLPFSYLVLGRSSNPGKSLTDWLPQLNGTRTRHRLVSPAFKTGPDQEFFVCGQEGKKRARYRAPASEDAPSQLMRGDILGDAVIRGDSNASRVQSLSKLV